MASEGRPPAADGPAGTGYVAERRRNPFVNSSTGARVLSALQLPWFMTLPPAGYGVLTMTGRRTGKRRRKCLRAIRHGDKVYVVDMKGGTAWMKNIRANPDVRLRIRGGRFSGVARALRDAAETQDATDAYCESVRPFDYLTFTQWRKGRPTRGKIKELFHAWFRLGTPMVIELSNRR